MLLPNALAGITTAFLLYLGVKKWYGGVSGLIASFIFAITPVATLMFRFNNPDSILTLLLVASAYFFILAIDSTRSRWFVLANIFIGTAFLTKMIQAFIILPVFYLIYLFFAKPKLSKRFIQIIYGGVALIASSCWWPIIVSIAPKNSRPYIGSSTANSIWDLILGYNGFGRLLGSMSLNLSLDTPVSGNGPMGGMGGGNAGFGGSAGLFRMFNSSFGFQISWLIPLALIILLLGLWFTRQNKREDQTRIGYLLWGGWLLLHMIVFSAVKGVIHPYYSIVLAPAVAALAGMGLPLLWQIYKHRLVESWVIPIGILITSIWSAILISKGNGPSWIIWLVVISAIISILIFSVLILEIKKNKKYELAALTLFFITISIGPFSASLATAKTAQNGSIPMAAFNSESNGAKFGRDNGNGFDKMQSDQVENRPVLEGEQSRLGGDPGGEAVDNKLISYLLSHKGNTTWIAATSSTQSAAPIELATTEAVMALGGFTGSDKAITLAEFKRLVSEGKIKYVIVNSEGGGPGGNNDQITAWAKSKGKLIDYGGQSSNLYEVSI
jgi:4-amino-4-deoxy-L-arabinose transferase-like glycosyltransferase